ncbi:t-SNARE affecting a late Golgi compartment protein 1 [Cytospora mali]|uniref:t-SNARE affecting a late Golgi compartment protein 1 n=1 Tax=Cytospora mali TaxID=578113 RepID=A0A194V073_CYTMA|nr:t-SNARE affecting a late Golgi compartment protein 1 [Valsa mali var. pyri (nom. inval.)]
MSSTNEEDPFLQVQQDVLTQMEQTRPLFTSYLRIRSLSTTKTSPELASARSDLESALESLAEDLADLVESVNAVEANPAQYGLSVHEVQRRKRLVQEIGGEVEDMREELNKHNTLSTGGGAGRRAGGGGGTTDLPDPNAFAIPGGEDGEGDEDYTAEFEQHQQVAMMREQDEHLDGVFQTVGNLRRMADDMGREMEEQVEMLEVTDGLADRVGGRLQTGMDKLRYVVRHNEDTLSSWCIGLLILVLCILLVLLLVV